MKRAFAVAILAAVVTLTSSPALAGVEDFKFVDFEADYTLTRDADSIGHLHTVERLDALFPDFDQNHGIIRALPEVYEGHDVHLDVKSVADDTGAALNYSKSSANSNLELKIGDAGTYVHGPQSYVITYDSDHVSAKPGGYDALIWDVNGDAWSQPFEHVTARIHLNPDLLEHRDQAHDRCFTGVRGSTEKSCTISYGNPVTVEATRALGPGETLTFELGFTPNTFAKYTMPLNDLLKIVFNILLAVVPILITLWITVRRWWIYGRDPSGKGIIVPEYVPPKDLTVLEASAIKNEGFKPSAITATILDLAVRRYLKIYEVKTKIPLLPDPTSYDIELVKSPADLKSDEQQVLNMLGLTEGARVKVDKMATTLYKDAEKLGKSVNQAVATAGYFRTNPDKAKTPFQVGAGILGFAAFGAFFLSPPLAIGLGLSAVITLAVSFVMPARTTQGVEARDHLLGLKMYMTVAEEDRIKAMQSPHGELTEKIDVYDKGQLVKVFERLLPYAMIYGIEKQWIKEFAGLYAQPPDWYSGSSTFNAVYFASAMSNFGTAATSGFTPPSSSGGGGSAGGGGGGGGGGGW